MESWRPDAPLSCVECKTETIRLCDNCCDPICPQHTAHRGEWEICAECIKLYDPREMDEQAKNELADVQACIVVQLMEYAEKHADYAQGGSLGGARIRYGGELGLTEITLASGERYMMTLAKREAATPGAAATTEAR